MQSIGHRAPIIADVALLLTRVAVGGTFIAHGWQKWQTNGIGATAGGFEQMGIPMPETAAWYSTLAELIGGALLVLGLLMPLAGLALFLNMAGAFYYVHAENGIFVDQGGFELVMLLGITSLLLAIIGSGSLGVDGMLGKRARAVDPHPKTAAAGTASSDSTKRDSKKREKKRDKKRSDDTVRDSRDDTSRTSESTSRRTDEPTSDHGQKSSDAGHSTTDSSTGTGGLGNPRRTTGSDTDGTSSTS